jgi:hypothetical protein
VKDVDGFAFFFLGFSSTFFFFSSYGLYPPWFGQLLAFIMTGVIFFRGRNFGL